MPLTRPADGHPLVVMSTWYGDDGQHVYPKSMKVPLDQIARSEWPKFWQTYPALDVLETCWSDDAHTVQYTVEGEASFPRLSKSHPEALEWLATRGGRVWMVALFLDLDLPGHSKAAELSKDVLMSWWEQNLRTLRSTELGRCAGWYRTQGGVRFVWLLDPWVSPILWPALFGRVRRMFPGADDTGDWTRLMRLPRVVRQGVELRHKMDLSQMVPADVVRMLGSTPEDLAAESLSAARVEKRRPERRGLPPTRVPETEADLACLRIAQAELETMIRKIGNHRIKGDRNALLYWAAVRLGEVVEWLDQDRAEAELVSAALRAGLRGGESEASATVSSGVERGLSDPRDLRREVLERAVEMEILCGRGK